jgi:hypothetical protein
MCVGNRSDTYTDEEAAEMERLFHALLHARPNGWSVVRGLAEIVIRPVNRSAGKISVSITPTRGDEVTAAFFSRSRNRWVARGRFATAEMTPEVLFDWVRSEVQRDALWVLP